MSGLTVIVHHLPAPQGSKRHVGGGRMIESSQQVAGYRDAVAAAALAARDGAPTLEGPLTLTVTFTLPRPDGHYGTGRNAGRLLPSAPTHPSIHPDLDKLLRATLDALDEDTKTIRNDSRIVEITTRKVYPGGHLDALDTPGAIIHLQTQD